jgi:hypothetical protein
LTCFALRFLLAWGISSRVVNTKGISPFCT